MAKAQTLIYTALLAETKDEEEKVMLQWNLTSISNKASLAKQMQTDSIQLKQETLDKYTGVYLPATTGRRGSHITILLKKNKLYRHVNVGEDVCLIPISAGKFVYNDDSGRAFEFVSDKNGTTTSAILSRMDGMVIFGKKP